jgi:hypothetical protein
MPETVFFKDGKLDFLTFTDRDSCINFDPKTKMEYIAVRERLALCVKERRNDTEIHGKQKAINDKSRKVAS